MAGQVIKAVFWDVGGVLVRTEDWEPREKLAHRLGFTRFELEGMVFGNESGQRAQRGEISKAELWEQVRRQLRLAPEELPAVQEQFFAGDRLDAILVDYISSLRPRFLTGIISNANRDFRRDLTELWEISSCFDDILLSAEVGVMKPAAQIFWMALARLSIQPQEAVFLDDFVENVAGAQAVGMRAIHFRTPQQAIGQLEAILEPV
jgi:putative hydrolase of the HAD superfamily